MIRNDKRNEENLDSAEKSIIKSMKTFILHSGIGITKVKPKLSIKPVGYVCGQEKKKHGFFLTLLIEKNLYIRESNIFVLETHGK